MFVDRAFIFVQGGSGGHGARSFRREAYVPKGGPDGGDGGNGGSVFLLASPQLDTLLDLTSRHHWRARPGRNGQAKSRHGKAGEDLTIRVPPGTLVYDDQSGELLDDLDVPDKTLLVASGGRGGYGNEHFKSALNQTPRRTTPGEPGQERQLRLELKLIAEIALVGKPNAGKSTFLSRVSAARPKIADYPFTTLQPRPAIAELPGYRRLVLADIPGLIEHAATGRGLGHEFLKHIERTRLLLHLLELDPADGSSPVENYRVIRRELAEYSPALANKPEIIALNKTDLLPDAEDQAAAVDLLQAELGRPLHLISAATGHGCPELLEACWKRVRESEPEAA